MIRQNSILVFSFSFFNFFSDFDSDDEETEKTSNEIVGENRTRQFSTKNGSVDHFSSTKNNDSFDHSSTTTFGGEPRQTESGPSMDKYYDYYFKYYTEKFGVVAADPNSHTTPDVKPEESTKIVTLENSSNIKEVSNKTDSNKKTSQFLVEYSGSEDDDN
jgi:hypothetical protein